MTPVKDEIPPLVDILPMCYGWDKLESDLQEAIRRRVELLTKPDSRMMIEQFDVRIQQALDWRGTIRLNGVNYLAAAEVRIRLQHADDEGLTAQLDFIIPASA